MEVTLVSGKFSTICGGVCNHSKLVYEAISPKIKVNKISHEDSIFHPDMGKSRLYNGASFFYFNLIDMKRILNKDKYKNTDIFHSIDPFQAFYLPKNKSISWVLDFFPLDADPFSAKLFEKCLNKIVEFERLIANNDDIKLKLNEEYGYDLSLIDVIPPPIDDIFYPTKKENDIYTIGTIAHLVDRKRPELLLKSFLEADIEDSQLLIGGNGSALPNLKKLAGNDERIKFLGHVPDESVNDFYNSLDVFVFPTIREGYGMPIVEAMGCGKPVITLEDAEIPSNVKDKTMVVSKEELSETLINRKFNCNINKNIEFYKLHSKDNIGSKLIKIYEDML